MCLQTTQVRPYQKWHWAGDEIVHDTIIPASRYVPDTRPKKRFDIDIREYLSIAGNAVVRRELRNLIDGLPADGQNRFFIGAQGNFDFRADKITQHFGRLKYIPVGRGFDTWMFPDETLARGGGDCEDLAFLMAALLESAGISQFCIR
ncbi:MAG: hypothetical protein M1608_03415, partial [Candidatus Omnitrophica bacterium]|nr:hypothetical protein [Candidatus Omnitrophota bacterium]